jgi:PAS domain S-box-containing protein
MASKESVRGGLAGPVHEDKPSAAGNGPARGTWPAWAVLVLSLLLTAIAWRWTSDQARQGQESEFLMRTTAIREALRARITSYEQVLRGAGALFAASDGVTRAEWRAYFHSQQLDKGYPAILALAFARALSHEELPALKRELHGQGLTGFEVRPPGIRERYVVNAYTEPDADWNNKALGYDMWQDPIRRETMKRALDLRQPAITPKVVLKIDETSNPVPAFIMYMPAFDRSGRLLGFVLSPVRMPALAADLQAPTTQGVSFAIYDGAESVESALLHRSAQPNGHRPQFSRSEAVGFAGRQWLIAFDSEPALEASEGSRTARFVLAAGALLSFSLFALVRGIAIGRQRALALARAMTADLHEKQRFLSDLIEGSSAPIFVKDRDGRLLMVNRRWEEVTGQARQGALGKTNGELFPDEVARAIGEADREVLDSGRACEREMRLPTREGPRSFISLRFPLKNDAGEVTGLCGVITDITERKQHEDAMQRLNRELERRVDERTAELQTAVRELESFSYSVSHDLRAPLRAINGYSQLLEQDYAANLDETARGYLARVRAGSVKMGNLIDDLLGLASVSRQSLHFKPVDLSLLAGEIAAELEAAEPGRRVSWSIAPGVTATCDAGLMRAVLANLLGNAWKYSAGCAEARIAFGVETVDGEPAFFVRDNGVGFDMKYAGKLFGAFQRLHSPAEFPGSGIGLATVARIVQRHGGRVWAEGRPGAGAAFHFSLRSGAVSQDRPQD